VSDVRAGQRYPTLGILGGMGPTATARFYGQVVALLQARGARLNCDFPEMVIHSVCAPDNVDADVEAPLLATMLRSARLLERAGAAVIAIPCNSAHIFVRELERACAAEVVNMVKETALSVAAGGCARPLLLGTRSTLRAGIYPRFGPGLDYVLPSAGDRDRVTEVILQIAAGRIDDALRGELLAIIDAYPEADSVVLGCTELPLGLRPGSCGRPVFDSSQVLAEAVVAARVAGAAGGDP
jgi:aspartate racemase